MNGRKSKLINRKAAELVTKNPGMYQDRWDGKTFISGKRQAKRVVKQLMALNS